MLASKITAERCAGAEHEYGLVLADVCLRIVNQRVANALLVRGVIHTDWRNAFFRAG